MKNKRSVVILVFNSKRELALQLRAAHDNSYPLHWDFSAAGGINENEPLETAALRELQEELGIVVALQFVGEEVFEDTSQRDHLFIFTAFYSGEFQPNPDEVAEVRFFSTDEVQGMLDSNEKFHPEFPFLWEKCIKALVRKS